MSYNFLKLLSLSLSLEKLVLRPLKTHTHETFLTLVMLVAYQTTLSNHSSPLLLQKNTNNPFEQANFRDAIISPVH